MASVIARVELHSASWQDYENLHAFMAAEGYSKTVRANDGTTFQLPTGTYVNSAVRSGSDGAEKAYRAAQRTGRTSSVFVGGWDGTWNGYGLSRVS